MSEYNIKYDNMAPKIKVGRKNDIVLMECFLKHRFTGSTLTRLIKIRIHLKVFTLLDIYKGSRGEMTKNAGEGRFVETDCR